MKSMDCLQIFALERTLVLLAVTTGLRRSELFALKWKDVDLDTAPRVRQHVSRARTDEKGFGVNCALTAKHGIRHSLRLAFERRFWLMLIPLGRWNVGVWRAIGKALECVSNT